MTRKKSGPIRIDKLTPKQEARFAEWRDKWIRIGLSTEPADRERFERAAIECYKFAGLAAPKRIVWVQSPLVLAFAGPIASHLLAKGSGGAVRGAVGDAVRDAVRGAVGDAVDDAVDDAVGDAVDDAWSCYLGGQFWVGSWWGSPAFVSFFREVCGLRLSADIEARADAYQATCESACWWWPHRDFVIACERPSRISKMFDGPADIRGRLHSETGYAVEFRDGWGVASWRGTIVPIDWIRNRKTLDPRIALTDSSVERRRAAAEIVGWQRVLASLPNNVIDVDPDPMIGKLIDVDLPDAPASRFLLVRCATGRDFALPVPRECATALAANAWTYGIESLDLKQLEART